MPRRRFLRRRVTFRRRRFGPRSSRRRRLYRVRRRLSGRRRRSTRPELKSYVKLSSGPYNFDQAWGSAQGISNLVVTGNNAAQRIGRSICIRKLTIWLDLVRNPASPLAAGEYVRFVLWCQKGKTGPTAWEDLYDPSWNSTDYQKMCIFGERLKGTTNAILYDKRIRLDPGIVPWSTSSTARGYRKIVIRFRKGLRETIVGIPTGAAETERPNTLWFNTFGEQMFASGTFPVGAIGWRLDYTDV